MVWFQKDGWFERKRDIFNTNSEKEMADFGQMVQEYLESQCTNKTDHFHVACVEEQRSYMEKFTKKGLAGALTVCSMWGG